MLKSKQSNTLQIYNFDVKLFNYVNFYSVATFYNIKKCISWLIWSNLIAYIIKNTKDPNGPDS